MHNDSSSIALPQGAGLGLRRALLDEFDAVDADRIDFIELAPENWIGVGGRFQRRLRAVTERFPVLLHGLSLDIGGQRPLDRQLIDNIKRLKRELRAPLYSEHLTSCADDGHLYDLLPLPFTEQAVRHVAARVDPTLYRWSGGRVTVTGVPTLPMLVLTTTGRRSGLPRTVQLAHLAEPGGGWLVVASATGQDRHPDWLLNLRADPRAQALVGGREVPVHAVDRYS